MDFDASASQPVLTRDQQRLFDKLGREFDKREYTKAIRTADSILSAAHEHADTLALKGLALHNMDRKEEGRELIKRAISLAPMSTMSWHSLGICERSDRNNTAAIKAFKRALVVDPNNINVLRDLSSVCVQQRDWDMFLEVREKMVTLKASVRANWIALSCARRMLGHTKMAAAVMDVMVAIMDCGETPVEVSEAHMYRVELELMNGNASKALDILKRHDAEIIDEYAKQLLRAKAHTQLGQKVEAEKRYMEMISTGLAESECIAAVAQLRKIPLDSQRRPKRDVDRYMELLAQVLEVAPRSDYAKRHRLECVPMEQFKEHLVAYASAFVVKLIPSLFGVFKSLYHDTERVKVIEEVFLGWEAEVTNGDFSAFGGQRDPCYILWIYTFLASHYRRTGDFARAHDYIDKAIAHTPTLEILYVEKARIYRREGKTREAAEEADKARLLDLQDKYLNGKAAKYFLRDNQIAKGEETMQLFFKASVAEGDTYLTLLESQCLWYECEVGDAFYRLGDYLSALQNYLLFEVHHQHNHNELSDFHNYVFRRMTIRAWFDVLNNDDTMERHTFFLRLCPRIVRTYIRVYELGEDAVRAANVPRPELPATLAAEDAIRLKQLRKDFYLEQMDLSEPLQKAERYMNCLIAHRTNEVETNLLAVEYFTKRMKPLLVARHLSVLSRMKYPGTAGLLDAYELGIYSNGITAIAPPVKEIIDELLQVARG